MALQSRLLIRRRLEQHDEVPRRRSRGLATSLPDVTKVLLDARDRCCQKRAPDVDLPHEDEPSPTVCFEKARHQ